MTSSTSDRDGTPRVEVASVLLESDVRLPLPRSSAVGVPVVRVRAPQGPAPAVNALVPRWLDEAGEPLAHVGCGDAGYFLKRRGGDLLRFSHGGGAVDFWPAEESPLLWAHFVLDLALPLELSRRRPLVFHGAVVENRGGAVAVLGDSGAGKSTVASAWAARGGRFLADDWFVAEEGGAGFRIRPTHPSLRVGPGTPAPAGKDLFADLGMPEARGRRWLVVSADSGLFGTLPLPLDRILIWKRSRETSGATGRRLTTSETMDSLLRAFFALELENAALWADWLPRLGALAGSCEGVEVTVPDGLEGLEAGLALLAG